MPDRQQTLTGSALTGRTVLAFDLETVSPDVPADEYPDFDDPGEFELLAATVAVQEAGTRPDETPDRAEVLFRKGTTPATEAALGERLLGALEAADPDTLVTFNGERFDLPVSVGRLERAGATGAAAALSDLFDNLDHLDLKHSAWSAYGNYTSLEALCEHQGLSVVRTPWADYDLDLPGVDAVRARSQESYATSADVAAAGEVYLTAREEGAEVSALEALLTDYALADVDHLFTLADRHPF
jgi:hypothetical protein